MICSTCFHSVGSISVKTQMFYYEEDTTIPLHTQVPVWKCNACHKEWIMPEAKYSRSEAINRYLNNKNKPFLVTFINEICEIPPNLAVEKYEQIVDRMQKDYCGTVLLMQCGDRTVFTDDGMEPEDASFHRDLGWVQSWLILAYNYGVTVGREEAK